MSMLRKLVMPVMAVAVLAVFCGCGEKTTAEKAGDAVENGVKAVQDAMSPRKVPKRLIISPRMSGNNHLLSCKEEEAPEWSLSFFVF